MTTCFVCLFSDGTVGDVDFSAEQWTGVSAPLNGIDLAPEPLYEQAKAHPLVASRLRLSGIPGDSRRLNGRHSRGRPAMGAVAIRSRAARRRTAVFGVSAGGELALALGLRHPDVYGAFWSEEFPLMVAWAFGS